MLMTRLYPDLGSAFDWSCRVGNLIQPFRSTTQIRVVTLHQYGFSALVSQTSFAGETSGSVAKCRLFSQAIFVAHFSVRLRDTIEPPWTTSSCKRPPMQNTKIFPVKALQLEPLVNDHGISCKRPRPLFGPDG